MKHRDVIGAVLGPALLFEMGFVNIEIRAVRLARKMVFEIPAVLAGQQAMLTKRVKTDGVVHLGAIAHAEGFGEPVIETGLHRLA